MEQNHIQEALDNDNDDRNFVWLYNVMIIMCVTVWYERSDEQINKIYNTINC